MRLVTRSLMLLTLVAVASGCRPSYGVRLPVLNAPIADVSGTWNTQWEEYVAVVFLKQEGEEVSGTYTTTARPEPGVAGTIGGTLEGRLVGNELRGKWDEGGNRFGSFRFVFRSDAAAFEGTWGNGASDDTGGIWVGSR